MASDVDNCGGPWQGVLASGGLERGPPGVMGGIRRAGGGIDPIHSILCTACTTAQCTVCSVDRPPPEKSRACGTNSEEVR